MFVALSMENVVAICFDIVQGLSGRVLGRYFIQEFGLSGPL